MNKQNGFSFNEKIINAHLSNMKKFKVSFSINLGIKINTYSRWNFYFDRKFYPKQKRIEVVPLNFQGIRYQSRWSHKLVITHRWTIKILKNCKILM